LLPNDAPVAADHGAAVQPGRPRIAIVGEHDAVRDHHLVLELHTFAQKTVGRDLAAAAHDAARLNLDERTNGSFVAYFTTIDVD
jgi:hypothetical protein